MLLEWVLRPDYWDAQVPDEGGLRLAALPFHDVMA